MRRSTSSSSARASPDSRAACHLSRELPQKSYAIVEARDKLGGTWDLFRYPGVRSDSDLPTYAFKPWKNRKTFAGGDKILAYLREAAAEHERLLTREPVIDPAMRLKAAPSTPVPHGEPVA